MAIQWYHIYVGKRFQMLAYNHIHHLPVGFQSLVRFDFDISVTQISKGDTKIFRHVNATKSYLHFDHFAGEAILCSNFFCFLLFLDVLFLS